MQYESSYGHKHDVQRFAARLYSNSRHNKNEASPENVEPSHKIAEGAGSRERRVSRCSKTRVAEAKLSGDLYAIQHVPAVGRAHSKGILEMVSLQKHMKFLHCR